MSEKISILHWRQQKK